jgi:hypothetical protein
MSTETEPNMSKEDPDFDIEDELVKKSLESGVDLREYSANIESQLRGVNKLAVHDCVKHAEQLAELHNQLTECDQVFGVSKFPLFSYVKK